MNIFDSKLSKIIVCICRYRAVTADLGLEGLASRGGPEICFIELDGTYVGILPSNAFQ